MLLAVLLAAQQPPPATTGLYSAGDLQDRCVAGDAADASYCFAYVAGVFDAVRAYERWLNFREFCTPPHIAQGDLRRAFLDYLDQYPGYRSGEAASVIVVALKKRFPCGANALPAPAAPKP